MIDVSRLKELLKYNPETGIFTRIKIETPGNQRYLNTVAGNIDRKGYRVICVDGRTYKAHRLAWLYMTGKMPFNQIDHKNGIKSDNRFSNLREATAYQNQQNRLAPSYNTSGYKGVHYYPRKRPWRATIVHDGIRTYLGCFYTKEEASNAYAVAAKIYHNDFAKVYDL